MKKTHKVGNRCSPREVKSVNRFVAGAAPSPVQAKKVCSAPRLSPLCMARPHASCVAAGTDSCGRDDCGRHQGRHPRPRQGLSDGPPPTIQCTCGATAACTPFGTPCGAQVKKIRVANLQKVPYIGTRVEGKNLASSGKHHSSLCFWYLGLHCFLGHATASQLGCIFGRYPGVIIHTDRDMNYATIKCETGRKWSKHM